MRALTAYLTTRGRAFVAAGIVLLVAGFALGVLDLTRIGVLILALPLIGGLATRRHHLALAITRTVKPGRVHIDEPATVAMTVVNPGSQRSPMLMAEEHLDYALGDRPRFVVPSLRPREHSEIHYTVRSHTRGLHHLGPTGVRVRDPFGMTTRTALSSGTCDLIVLPRVVELGSARPGGSGLGSEGALPHMVALRGEDDVSVREYRDGDDLRRIHWPATARMGDLMVRQEDRPSRRRAVLLLDSRRTAHGGSGVSGSFEWAVTAVASVATHLLKDGYAVHLLTPDGTSDEHVRESTAPDEVLDALAVVEASGAESFAQLLHAAHSMTSAGGLVIAVTAALDEATARALAALRQPGSTALGLVLDGAAFAAGRRHASATASVGAAATAAVLRGAGWSAVTVSPHVEVATAWGAVVTTGSAVAS